MEEDIDPDLRDDILKPASTRSKIVVNLKEMKDENGKKRPFKSTDPIEYELDPYDKVRMRLLKEDEALYKAYLKTISEIQNNPKYQPKKLKIGWCRWFWTSFLQILIIIIFFYIFLLIIQLSLFNLVILGIMMKALYQIYVLTDALKWKQNFSSRTNAFNEFIKDQNVIYKNMNIEIIAEREGLWLEFLLKEEEQMFEELIAERR